MNPTEIRGGNKRPVQVRKAQRGFFTEEKRQIFLDHLAACCNVKAAAAAAEISVSAVYDTRRREPGFAQAWDEAMEIGYATLEALLIERAAKGGHYVPGDTPVPGPETIDTWLAMDLLRLHKKSGAGRNKGGRPARRASETETIAAILKGLEVIRRRTLRRRSGQALKGRRPGRRGGGEAEPDPVRPNPSPRPLPMGEAVEPVDQ